MSPIILRFSLLQLFLKDLVSPERNRAEEFVDGVRNMATLVRGAAMLFETYQQLKGGSQQNYKGSRGRRR